MQSTAVCTVRDCMRVPTATHRGHTHSHQRRRTRVGPACTWTHTSIAGGRERKAMYVCGSSYQMRGREAAIFAKSAVVNEGKRLAWAPNPSLHFHSTQRKNTNTVTHRTTGSSGRWARLGNAAPSSRHTSSLYTCAVAASPLRVTPHSGHGCGIVADSSAVEPTKRKMMKTDSSDSSDSQGRGFFGFVGL
jgi:hypothetical protein